MDLMGLEEETCVFHFISFCMLLIFFQLMYNQVKQEYMKEFGGVRGTQERQSETSTRKRCPDGRDRPLLRGSASVANFQSSKSPRGRKGGRFCWERE